MENQPNISMDHVLPRPANEQCPRCRDWFPSQALGFHQEDCTAIEHVQVDGKVETLDRMASRETEPSPNPLPNTEGEAEWEPSETSSESWRPIVLSLDGGGIRGLSSLFIIREIMKQIQRLENPYGVSDATLPLPCHYFDFMVGTGAGGLTAIMLSRLRMDIDDCIREYHVFGNSVFRPHRRKFFRYMSRRFQYSPEKFRKAVETIVSNYCGCAERSSSCRDHLFRQADFAEEWDIAGKPRVNKTCKAVVTALREGGGTTNGARNADVPYLFRTYNHHARGIDVEINPRSLDTSRLTIVDACQATLADPTWFPTLNLNGRRFIGGGVTDYNNPATLAFREANQMVHKLGDTKDIATNKSPQVVLSIGTGKTGQPRVFGLYNLLLSARHKLTDTERSHLDIKAWIPGYRCAYWRFNVPESSSSYEKRGLDTVRYDTCKKERIESFWKKSKTTDSDETDSFQDADPEDRKGGYKPHKYRYRTYEKIRERTVRYCRDNSPVDGEPAGSESVAMQIASCAQRLFELSQERRKDRVRWAEFQQNPNLLSRMPLNDEA